MTDRHLDSDLDADFDADLDVLGGSSEAAPRSAGAHRHRHRKTDRPGSARAGKGKRGRTFAALLVVLVMLGGLGGGIWYGGSRVLSAFGNTPDFTGAGSGDVTVQIKAGDTASDVANTLAKAGVVKSPKAFVSVAQSDPRSTALQPGTYRLRKQMKASLALNLLFDPISRLRSLIALPEGFSVTQTLARIAARTGLPLAQLQAVANDPTQLGLPAYAHGKPEGFLFPATYDFEPGTPPLKMLQAMTAKFNTMAASTRLEQRAAAMKRSPYAVLIVASLVQEEGLVVSDMPKIAQVIYNRLAAGTPLGIDASVFYGLGRTGGELSAADLAKKTPYNNRLVKGLPPTPIDSPGEAAIDAALAPTPGNWLYYVLKDNQGHQFFTNSYPAFIAQKAKSKSEGLFK